LKSLKIAFVASLWLVLWGAVTGRAEPFAQSEMRLDASYGPDPAQHLDLCLPATENTERRAAVVMIHGGYWIEGDKSAYDQLCKTAADQGIVAITINYRLADASEHNRWPAQLVDAQLAVRWLRFHAVEFGVDPTRICALGDSAGAHLAVFLAVLDRTAPGDYSSEKPSVSSNIACAVDNFGPIDLSADTYWPPVQQLFGNDSRNKQAEHEASPIFFIKQTTAPIMIAHGRADKAVNVDQSLQLYDRLSREHVPVRMTLLDCGHEFLGLSTQEISKILQTELDFIKDSRARANNS
jgi:acetyl esterase/lipase